MTQLLEVAPREITTHPKNVRHVIGNLDELADSIKELGILEPLVVAPQSNGGKGKYQLIAGHRRLAAAKLARVKVVPVILRTDLDTADRQIEAALVENLHRADLSPIEEAEGYQLLLEFPGYTQAGIAKAIGRSAGTVRDRLKLTKLPAKTRDRIHQGQITLADAAALADYAADPDALKRLEQYVGTTSMSWAIERERERRRDAKAAVKIRKELEDQGVRIVSDPGIKYNGDAGPRVLNEYGGPRLDPEEHAKSCEHHAVVEPKSALLKYVCLDPSVHDDIDNTGRQLTKSERDLLKAERAADEQFKADHATGTSLRWQAVRELSIERRLPSARLTEFIVKLCIHHGIEPSVELWARFLGAPDEISSDYEAADAYIRVQLVRSDRMLFLAIAADLEDDLQHPWSWRRLNDAQLAWLDLLASTGYQPSAFEAACIKSAQDQAAEEAAAARSDADDSGEQATQSED